MLYDSLLELPLFQGMSRSDLDEAVSKTKFGFAKYAAHKTVVSEGQTLTCLYFLISGTLEAHACADNNSYSLTEHIVSPSVLQPERIFGLTQRYTHTFTSLTPCSFLRLEKAEVLRLAQTYEIFRLNLLNIVSTQSQKLTRLPWRTPPQTIRQKVVRFVEDRSIRPTGTKTLNIKMETLAVLIGESRLNLSRCLNEMHAEGIIHISRAIITIPSLEKLHEVAFSQP